MTSPFDLPWDPPENDPNSPAVDALSRSLPGIEPPKSHNLPLNRRNSETSAVVPLSPRTYLRPPSQWFKKKNSYPLILPLSYTIEYSVFRPLGYIGCISNETQLRSHQAFVLAQDGYDPAHGIFPPNYVSESDFIHLVSTMTHDVDLDPDLIPRRVTRGSLGSYFIMGKRPVSPDFISSSSSASNGPLHQIYTRGIFKPKDEEPYGPLSPKWSKWLHRTFFPCFFGRSCLIPNLGYISEAAACVLDRLLFSYIVPYTDIIYLKSPAFYYSFWERTRSRVPRFKIGSFQMFLHDCVEAQMFFKMYPLPTDIDRLQTSRYIEVEDELPLDKIRLRFQWTKELLQQFQEQLEKLVILDYIMRNTDRGSDNWMILLEWREHSRNGQIRKLYPYLKIGAIDSGLAFPWKHPDEWRSFPFGWLFLPYSIIGQPFSAKTRLHYLPLLTSKYWWEKTVADLRKVFAQDTDFKERMWQKQVAVLKGQAFNVVEILKLNYAGPLELTRRETLFIWDDEMNVPILVDNSLIDNALQTDIYETRPSQTGKAPTSSPGKNLSVSNETTPLLEHKKPPRISGFEFNLNYKDDGTADDKEERTDTKRVVIERLEKVHSKPPVFTWC